MIKKMEHTAIIVGDMDETIHYYSDMFGFKVRLKGSTEKREMAFLYLEEQPELKLSSFEILIRLASITKVGLLTTLHLR
ncbi:VOC family protein [Priestia sp. OVL9]|nr:VOC family protein [Priestia sp. OVL9]